VEILGIVANDEGRGGLAGLAAKQFVEVAQVVVGLDRPAGVAQGGGQALQRQRNFGTGGLGLHQEALIGPDGLLGAPETMRQEGGHAHGACAREHLERLLIGGQGAFDVAQRQGAEGDVLQGVAVAGLQLQNTAVMDDRLGELEPAQVGRRQQQSGLHRTRQALDQPPHQGLRLGRVVFDEAVEIVDQGQALRSPAASRRHPYADPRRRRARGWDNPGGSGARPPRILGMRGAILACAPRDSNLERP
jgi:hypothetical protein